MNILIKMSIGLILLSQLNLLGKNNDANGKEIKKIYLKAFKKSKNIEEKINAIQLLEGHNGKHVVKILTKLLKNRDDKIKIATLELLAKLNGHPETSTNLIIKEFKNRTNHNSVKLKAIDLLKTQKLTFRSMNALIEELNKLNLSPPKKIKGVKHSDQPFTSVPPYRIMGDPSLNVTQNINVLTDKLETLPKSHKKHLEKLSLSIMIFSTINSLSNGQFKSSNINNPANQKILPWFKQNKKDLNIWWKKNKKDIFKKEKLFLKK
ncbi:MAG: hypothetical protein COA79_15120 [Planctomycetota bacterium]|nr:MAG: hypothetical protein COA79_15120 [Planctomycetota bacterium]